jgi:hypothetical protein
MRQDRGAPGHQRVTEGGKPLALVDILGEYRVRLFAQYPACRVDRAGPRRLERAPHPVYRPHEVNGGGPRRVQGGERSPHAGVEPVAPEPAVLHRRENDSVRRRGPDGRRSAYDHILDGELALLVSDALEERVLLRKFPLIDEAQAVRREFHRYDLSHRSLTSSC